MAAAFGAADPRDLLVGAESADDAAVFRLTDDLACVLTVDFFTPIVDDPYDFGRIAAANALSDVYAMGGEPRVCLNLMAFPRALGLDVAAAVLRGSADVVARSGALVAGGHTVEDQPHDVLRFGGFGGLRALDDNDDLAANTF